MGAPSLLLESWRSEPALSGAALLRPIPSACRIPCFPKLGEDQQCDKQWHPGTGNVWDAGDAEALAAPLWPAPAARGPEPTVQRRRTLGIYYCFPKAASRARYVAWEDSRPPKAASRSHGVMVSTLDFESSDPSSNLGGTSPYLLVLQLLFWRPPAVVGISCCAFSPVTYRTAV